MKELWDKAVLLQISFDNNLCVSYVCLRNVPFGEHLEKVTIYKVDIMVTNVTAASILQ